MDGTSNILDGSTRCKQASRMFAYMLTIKEKKIWLAEECSGQGQSHSPSSREGLSCKVLPLFRKAKTRQNARSSRLGFVRIHLRQLGMDIAESSIETLSFPV